MGIVYFFSLTLSGVCDMISAMLRMRLQRTGRKHEPHYRVVIAKKTAPVKGKYLTWIGHYNPAKELVDIDTDQALEWLNKGVTPSNRVARLLTKAGVKHKLVVVKTFRAKTAVEIEAQKTADEAKKAQEATGKEKAKAEFEAKQKEQAAAAEEKQKAEEAQKSEEKVEKKEPAIKAEAS